MGGCPINFEGKAQVVGKEPGIVEAIVVVAAAFATFINIAFDSWRCVELKGHQKPMGQHKASG